MRKGIKKSDDSSIVALKDIMLATLMGNGEIYKKNGIDFIYSTFNPINSTYIDNYIIHQKLGDYVELKSKTGELYIYPNPEMPELIKKWYRGRKKIFSNSLNPKELTFNSILIWINLFGKRQLNNLEIETTVEQTNIRILAFCVQEHLKTPILYGKGSMKISEIEELFLTSLHSSINDSSTLIHFLTRKEKKNIMQTIKEISY